MSSRMNNDDVVRHFGRARWPLAVALAGFALSACAPPATVGPGGGGQGAPSGSGGAAGAAGVSGNGTGGGPTGTGAAGTGAVVGTGGVATGSGGAGGAVVFPAGGPTAQVVPIRRLTNAEYVAAVTDLFPGFMLPSVTITPDIRVAGYLNISSSQNSSGILIEQYERAAQDISKFVAANPAMLTGCSATASSMPAAQLACAQPYLYGLAKRAYRRPLTTPEQTALTALFNADQTLVDYPSRLAQAIQGVLLSPKFLFRPELGGTAVAGAPDVKMLTPWEVATRLSFFVSGSIPDMALAAAAEAGTLTTATQVAEQARRLLALPRSQTNLVNFHTQWLKIDSVNALTKNATTYPGFTSATAVYMGQETRAFLQNVIFTQNGTFADLFLANYSFVNASMAAFYGVPAPTTEWGKVELPPAQRQGLLTQPSLLATLAKADNTDPVMRGKFVLEQLLCQTVASPSAAIQAMFPMMDLSKTARVRFGEHRANAICAACHNLLDPLGLPFEHFDGMGKWRDVDRNMALDVTGAVGGTTFDGIPAMEKVLVEKPEVRACYITQQFRVAMGKLDGDLDKDFIAFLSQKFGRDSKVVDSIVNLVQADSFRSLRSAP
ncbi:MAG: DUF1592 domain-containing protein [Verrucomicrobiota bacterium]